MNSCWKLVYPGGGGEDAPNNLSAADNWRDARKRRGPTTIRGMKTGHETNRGMPILGGVLHAVAGALSLTARTAILLMVSFVVMVFVALDPERVRTWCALAGAVFT
jgi:hypothetical protein